jgi:TRAP-type C4-dicarboxylate transport system substrate-binding protein
MRPAFMRRHGARKSKGNVMAGQISRRSLIAAAAVGVASPRIVRGVEPIRMRVSIESTPTHARTIAAADFCQKIDAGSEGQIKTELFHSGQLYTDQTVVRALVQNQVEMSIPGTWGLTGFVPSVDVLQLPVMYSRPVDTAHRLMDGKAGQLVNAELEGKLHVLVIGNWLDLGYENWYGTSRPLSSFDDLKNMKIRNSGGASKAWRTSFFGAIPNVTPWPSVSLALTQGTFDGLITTHETIASSSMWEAGVRHVLEDHQTFNAYVPLLAGAFWETLSPALQDLIKRTWSDNISAYRRRMVAAQDDARTVLLQHGMSFSTPDMQQIAEARTRMLARQDDLIRQWRITPDIARQAMNDANEAG